MAYILDRVDNSNNCSYCNINTDSSTTFEPPYISELKLRACFSPPNPQTHTLNQSKLQQKFNY